MLSRRGVLGGTLALVASPAIVRASSLMALPRPAIITVNSAGMTNSLITINQITREMVRRFAKYNGFVADMKAQQIEYNRFLSGIQWSPDQIERITLHASTS